MTSRFTSLLDRFEAKVCPEPMSGCWLWIGAVNSKGYGQMRIDYVAVYAHRFSYETFVGPIADGLVVMHRCDTPPCVNPAHLRLGTKEDNAVDRDTKGRQRPRGLVRPLTPDQVRGLRALHVGGASFAEAARVYGINRGSAWRLIKGETYKECTL